MLEDEPTVRVTVPEAEATALAAKLRNSDALRGVGLSVYAYISKSGKRALHVAVDWRVGRTDKYKSYDLRYNADVPTDQLYKNAVKRIVAHFNL